MLFPYLFILINNHVFFLFCFLRWWGGGGLGKILSALMLWLMFPLPTASSTIHWFPKSQTSGLISVREDRLTIRKGGYYFLSVQVTLTSCEEAQLRRTVELKLDNEVILVGWIDATTNSTGLLSKVEEVSTGVTLMVTINPPVKCFNYGESVTHLDIVYLPR
uniref:TNF family profile domain-containing protein n=1 Tax=Gouania willdenowi TaxID=441366 RepID=A0A8C5EUH8_GOUWI